MAQKVGEEATEVVIAALALGHSRDPGGEKIGKGKGEVAGDPRESGTPPPAPEAQGREREQKQRLVEEASDLLFHLLVLLQASDVTTIDLASELSARHRGRIQPTGDGSAPLPKDNAPATSIASEQREPTRHDDSETGTK